MLADGFDHPSLGERLARQERLRKEARHPMGTEAQGYSKEARLRRQEGTIEYLTAELDALRDTFNEVQRTADRNHKRAFEAETELSSLREAARAALDAAQGYASSTCSEFCIHSQDAPKDCPMNDPALATLATLLDPSPKNDGGGVSVFQDVTAAPSTPESQDSRNE